MTRRRPALLFDVMGTLVRDPFYEDIAPFFGVSFRRFVAEASSDSWVAFERGALPPAEYYRRMFEDGRHVDGRALERHLRRHYRWIDGIPALLSDLVGRGHELHAFSNYPVWYRIIEEALRVSRYLSWTLVSCETGRRKPEPETFRHAARTVGRAPSRCLLIDDRPANCRAAEAIGMQAVRFLTTDLLRRELQRRGLL